MDDIEAVQRRPGMYVGDTSNGAGLHNLLYAALDYAIAEVRCGSASTVAVDLHPDGSCTIAHDGDGMPITVPEEAARAFPEVLLTQIVFGIQHAVLTNKAETIENTGLVPVNALSTWLHIRTVWEGIEYLVKFESGRLFQSLTAIASSEWRLPNGGTAISFLPSARVFGASVFDQDTIKPTLRAIAETTGVVVALADHRGLGEPA